MPLNLTKVYNSLLDMLYPNFQANLASFRSVFNKDIANSAELKFRTKLVRPTTSHNGEDAMDRLFRHLTTVETDKKTKKREFESARSVRLHWIRHHLDEKKKDNVIVFSIENENRTYIVDKDERYVVILEPLRKLDEFYLITAYPLEASSYKNIMKRYEKRGVPVAPFAVCP